ncbi:MAG: hypothetical protein JKY80_00850 [Mariprofundaceae bacterium]|nr:hypothetical protein [Mariprofundaceae bacterium]
MGEAAIELSDERECYVESGDTFTYIQIGHIGDNNMKSIMLDNEDAAKIAKAVLLVTADLIKGDSDE